MVNNCCEEWELPDVGERNAETNSAADAEPAVAPDVKGDVSDDVVGAV